MSTKSLKEIAILRSITMLMVICIHFLNLPQLYLTVGSYEQGFYVLWRSLLVCAVPCFMFLSMMMISYHSRENLKLDTISFFQKRIYRIVIPYFVWSMVYLAFYYVIHYYTWEDFTDISNWIYWFVYGKANEHLYFMAIMCQFYFLTPLLYSVAKRYRNSVAKAITISIVPQIAMYWLNRLYIHQWYPLFSSSFAWYWCIGFFGLWFGFEYKNHLSWLNQHFKLILGCHVISLGIHLYYSKQIWHELWEIVSFDTFPYTMNMYVYMILSIVLMLLFCEKISCNISTKQNRREISFLIEISRYSYGIYLMHPLLMAVLRKLFIFSNPYIWVVVILIGVPIVASICGVITKYGEKLPIICYAFGKSS